MTEPTPTWRPVVGYEGAYKVSDTGSVWSVRTHRPLAPVRRYDGYLVVCLSSGGARRLASVHQLVMEAFVGPPPARLVTRHLDGDPTNNRLVNLCYGTEGENGLDRVRHGRDVNANKTACPKGHPYDAANTYRDPEGRRNCRACRAAGTRAYRSRKAVSA